MRLKTGSSLMRRSGGATVVVAVVVALALVLVATNAFARRPARLVYTRAPNTMACPDEAGLRSAVSTRLGYDPFEGAAATTAVVDVSVTKSTKLESSVRFRDEHGRLHGKKEISSAADDCAELAAAMALTISILLDPDAILGQPPAGAAAPPALHAGPHESPFTPEAPPPPPAPAAPSVDPWRVRLGADAIGSVGAAPAPALGLGAFAGLGRGALSLDFEVRADLPASITRDDGTGVRSSLVLGTVAPCGHLHVLALCVLGSAGALHGEGLNVGTPERDVTFYAAAGARAAVELTLSRTVFARMRADALAPLTRTTLKNRGSEYWSSPPVTGALALGLGVTFL